MAKRLAQVTGFPLPDGRRLDLDVHADEVVRITGPNGSGKTSLLRALAGLDSAVRPDAVTAGDCGFAMQTAMDSLIGLTVEGEFSLRDRPTPDDLTGLSDRDVAHLSAGEARRVAIRTAMGQGPLVLLDEPSEGLDAANRRRLAEAMHMTVQGHGAVVVADHGDHWADVADRTVDLGGTVEPFFAPFPPSSSQVILRTPSAPLRSGDRVLTSPSFDLFAGFHVLVGPNGCGKTQTLRHLSRCVEGPVRMLPAHAGDLLWGGSVAACLDGVDLDIRDRFVDGAVMDRHPWSLSGGEQQRVALAKVLGRPADVYLLDEPEAHLDAAGRDALHHVLERRIRDGACILAATHDVGLIAAAQTVTSMEGPA